MKSFLRTQLKIWAVVVALIGVGAATGAAAQAFDHQKSRTELTDQRHTQRFYGMIDGRIPADGNTVDVALATDLKQLLGAHDGRALPPSILNFRGTSSSYGGVSEMIGFKPFVDEFTGCTECGPLEDSVVTTLQQIKRNQTGQLFKPIHGNLTNSYTLTPFGLPWLAWILTLWFLAGPITVFIARYYKPEEFASIRRPNVKLWLLAPTYWIVHDILTGRKTRDSDRQVRQAFPEQMQAIDAADRLLTRYHGTKAADLLTVRNQVVSQLQSQTRRATTPADDLQLQQSMQELAKALEFLTARAEATRELTQSENH